MKTTFDLPADLVRQIKIRAVQDGQKLKDAVADLLRKGLAAEGGTIGRNRVKLPLIECHHQASLPPERVAEILTQQEAAWQHDSGGH